MEKRSESRKHCALAVIRRSQKNRPPQTRGAGRPKFNQLAGDGHYLYLQTKFGVDRSLMHAISSYRGVRGQNQALAPLLTTSRH